MILSSEGRTAAGERPVRLEYDHVALLLDDVEAFLAVVRMQPRLLIEEVYTGGNGKSLGLRDHQRGEVQVDPRVADLT